MNFKMFKFVKLGRSETKISKRWLNEFIPHF